MKHTQIMIDLETAGNVPGAAIIAIGAVAFDRNFGTEKDWDLFEVPVISEPSCESIGLRPDVSTINWWYKQPEEARKVFDAAMRGEGAHIVTALAQLHSFVVQQSEDVCVWGNGADFDNALLSVAYNRATMQVPWKYHNNRCFRTMKAESCVAAPEFVGTKHNALHDALHQTRWLREIWKRY